VGALYYGMSARREEVTLGDDVRDETRRAAELFHRIMREGVTPPPEFGPKCDGCSLQDLCMPRTARTRSAAGYLDAAMAPEGSDPR
jgi:CRISPR-associated exonuclease Cas4